MNRPIYSTIRPNETASAIWPRAYACGSTKREIRGGAAGCLRWGAAFSPFRSGRQLTNSATFGNTMEQQHIAKEDGNGKQPQPSTPVALCARVSSDRLSSRSLVDRTTRSSEKLRHDLRLQRKDFSQHA